MQLSACFTLLHMAAGPVLLGGAACGGACVLGWAGWAADGMLGSGVGSSFGGVLVCDMAARRDCSGSPGMPLAELGSAAEPSREVNAPWLGVLTGTTGDAMRGVLAGAPASTLVLMLGKPPARTAPETHTKLSLVQASGALLSIIKLPPRLCVLLQIAQRRPS